MDATQITKALEILVGETTWRSMARVAEMVALYGDEELEAIGDLYAPKSLAFTYETSQIAAAVGISTKQAYSILTKMERNAQVVRRGGGKGSDARWSL